MLIPKPMLGERLRRVIKKRETAPNVLSWVPSVVLVNPSPALIRQYQVKL
jgi:hypothetical protein